MSPIRKLLFVSVGILALHGVQACASETELNPQPLPPQGGESTNPAPDPKDVTGSSSGSSGGGVPAASPSDGGKDGEADGGDAGDAGVH